ncbi:hypothetical protein [Microcoleus sp. F10-C6]
MSAVPDRPILTTIAKSSQRLLAGIRDRPNLHQIFILKDLCFKEA